MHVFFAKYFNRRIVERHEKRKTIITLLLCIRLQNYICKKLDYNHPIIALTVPEPTRKHVLNFHLFKCNVPFFLATIFIQKYRNILSIIAVLYNEIILIFLFCIHASIANEICRICLQ